MLDKRLDGFNVGVPVYAPIPPAMEVANGEYFVMSKINPLFEQLRREEERRKKDVEMGLLMEDGTESEAQAALRVKVSERSERALIKTRIRVLLKLNNSILITRFIRFALASLKMLLASLGAEEGQDGVEGRRNEGENGRRVECRR